MSRSVHTTSLQTIKLLRSPASLVKVTGDRMPLPQFVDNGGDDDNGDDNSGAISVRAKVETGGSSQVQGSSGIKKKARKA
ncbi:BnaC05g26580D [Brassica napus]|uniref:Uncharacterized protein n=2 Tax=Brassica TaxID=3705 RepID=A0A0D3CG11_BRAOL|nr:unnamed protein product [Brassica napus]CDY07296.1 BnaC05g26580D [Brassica napus]